MTLRPILPVLPDESLTSYMRRIAAFHTDADVFAFLGMIELSRRDVVDPSPAVLDRIAALTGQPVGVLHWMVLRSIQPRIRVFGDEQFHTEFANLKQATFCPACLLEDGAAGSASRGLRVGRVSWLLEPVRTCARHDIALVRKPITAKSERFLHMDEVAPDDAELARLVAAAERRAPSALQRYVETRLDGGRGPEWLDGQPIDLAARACEMLGLILSHDATRTLPEASSAELDAAGGLGFSYAAQGDEGVRAALRVVHDRARADRLLGGPRRVFGFFYEWLRDSKQKAFGPIREATREYILDHFAVEQGTSLFGEIVVEQRKHTVHTLARKLASHPFKVQRVFVYAGLLDGDPRRASHHVIVDAAPAEALFARIGTALSSRELCDYLNCNRTQARQLVAAGILPQIVDPSDRARNSKKRFAKESADAFLSDLLGSARRVGQPSDGMGDIVRAAQATGRSAVDIVKAVLAGRFARVECVDPDLRFMAVLVDPAEVWAVLNRDAREIS